MTIQALLYPVAWKNVLQRGKNRGNNDNVKPKLRSYPKHICKKFDRQDRKVIISQPIKENIISQPIKESLHLQITISGKNVFIATKNVRAVFHDLYGKFYVMDEIIKSTFVHRHNHKISVYSFTVSYYKKIFDFSK